MLFYKATGKILSIIRLFINHWATLIVLYGNNVKFEKIRSKGVPFVRIERGGNCTIGDNFKMNNNIPANPIGRVQRCILLVKKGATLTIGRNVGMSSSAIVTHQQIEIGDNVIMGGGVCIYDTDFHSIEPAYRKDPKMDRQMRKCAKVTVGNNVFIGAHATLLKGVTIGENSIIGACSVVTHNVPSNEIWAGNPARFIKQISKHV